jgi:hypothetical protein
VAAESKSLLVNEVLLAYVEFAEKHYSDGQQVSTEFANLKHAIKPVKQLTVTWLLSSLVRWPSRRFVST